MSIDVYGIPNCDTVKKARAWLEARGTGYEFHDYKVEGVDETRLRGWVSELGWEPLVNRKGTTWRQLDAAAQQAVQDTASAQALMRSQPSAIKRPVVEWDGRPTVGFDAAGWQVLAESL